MAGGFHPSIRVSRFTSIGIITYTTAYDDRNNKVDQAQKVMSIWKVSGVHDFFPRRGVPAFRDTFLSLLLT